MSKKYTILSAKSFVQLQPVINCGLVWIQVNTKVISESDLKNLLLKTLGLSTKLQVACKIKLIVLKTL